MALLKLPKKFDPYLGIPGRKPVGPVEADPAHPAISSPLALQFFPNGADLVTGSGLSYTGAFFSQPAGMYGSGADGVAETPTTSSIDLDNLGSNLFFHSVLTLTDTVNFADLVTLKVGGSSVVIKNGSSTNSRIQVLGVGGGTKTYDVAFMRNAGDRVAVTGCVSLTRDFYAHLWNITTGQRATVTSSSIPTSFFGDTVVLRTTVTDGNAFCEVAYVGSRYVSEGAARALNLDPYALLKPANGLLYFTPSGPGNTTLTADPGVYTLGSDAVTFEWHQILTADPGVYTLGSDAVTFTEGLGATLTADPGVYTLGSDAVTFEWHQILTADPGVYTLGSDAVTFTVTSADTLTADPGVYTLGSDAVTFKWSRVLSADPGVYTLGGDGATFTTGVLATPECYTWLTSTITDAVWYTGDINDDALFLTGTINDDALFLTGTIDDDALFLTGEICK